MSTTKTDIPTLEEAVEAGLDEDLVTDIKWAVTIRDNVAYEERTLAEQKRSANSTLMPALTLASHLTGSTSLRVGDSIVSLVDSNRPSLDKDKLKDGLLRRGVGVDVVAEALSEATSMSQSTSVRLRKAN